MEKADGLHEDRGLCPGIQPSIRNTARVLFAGTEQEFDCAEHDA